MLNVGQLPQEVVIRSAFCNAHCIPCYAYSYSWPEKAKMNKEVVTVSVDRLIGEFIEFFNKTSIPGNKFSYNWFRILGGEPFLNNKSLKDYVNFLMNIPDDISPKFNRSILIQTNGIFLGTIGKDEMNEILSPLKDKPFKIIIEISIKGSNSEEFKIITQTHENSAKKFHEAHLTACETLEYIHTYIPNIDWTAVAGFGIGVTNLVAGNFNRKEYVKTFYHPETNKPFYHTDCWDNHF
ncbi:MAG: 4Fe-4S cluster-binding domain-containing protein [Candidatus Bathyarchaeia archaeon]